MRRVTLFLGLGALSLLLASCSVLFDGSGHTGGGGGDGGLSCANQLECWERDDAFLICNAASMCVSSCETDEDCSDHPLGEVCTGGGCGCATDMECPDARICDTAEGACATCLDDSECTNPTEPICDLDCFGCETDAECQGRDPSSPLCNTFTGACVACLTNDDCAAGQTCSDEGVCNSADPCDVDGDGFRVTGVGCDLMGLPEDCNDSDPDVYPTAFPTCADGVEVSCTASTPLGMLLPGFAEIGATRPTRMTDTDSGVGPQIHQLSVLVAPGSGTVLPDADAVVIRHSSGLARRAFATGIRLDGSVVDTIEPSVTSDFASVATLRAARVAGQTVVGVYGVIGARSVARLHRIDGTLMNEDAQNGLNSTFGLGFPEIGGIPAMAFRRRGGMVDTFQVIGMVDNRVDRPSGMGTDTWVGAAGTMVVGNTMGGVVLWDGFGTESRVFDSASEVWRGDIVATQDRLVAVLPNRTDGYGVAFLRPDCTSDLVACASEPFSPLPAPVLRYPDLAATSDSTSALLAFALDVPGGGDGVALRGLTPDGPTPFFPVMTELQTGITNLTVEDVAVDVVSQSGGGELVAVVAAVLRSGDGPPAVWTSTVRACRTP